MSHLQSKPHVIARNSSTAAQRRVKAYQLLFRGHTFAQPQNASKNSSNTRDLPAQTCEKPSLAATKLSFNFAITIDRNNVCAITTAHPARKRTFFTPQPFFAPSTLF